MNQPENMILQGMTRHHNEHTSSKSSPSSTAFTILVVLVVTSAILSCNTVQAFPNRHFSSDRRSDLDALRMPMQNREDVQSNHDDTDMIDNDEVEFQGLMKNSRHLVRNLRSNLRRSASRAIEACGTGEEGLMRIRVCQNCAKITGYNAAINECCFNKDNAFSWCKRLFDFTNPLG